MTRGRRTGREGAFPSVAARVREGVRQVSLPIGIDALALGTGFGILAFSQVPSSARLGLLVLTSLVTCLVVTLVVLPALLVLLRPRWMRTPLADGNADYADFADSKKGADSPPSKSA